MEQGEGKRIRTPVSIILIRAAIAGILVAGVVFLSINLFAWYTGVKEAERLKILSIPDGMEASDPALSAPEAQAEDLDKAGIGPEEPKQILPKYRKLLELNDEISGWIKIDGTRVDYPFVQHDDNEYYLHMSTENKKSARGSIYIDYRNDRDLKGKNTMVYGHNMKDGSMFKDLVRYKNRDFFNSHGIIHMDSLYEENDWKVFSVYVVDADKETINPYYADEEAFLRELNKYKDRSLYKTDVDFEGDDRIITLVTCSYETPNSRTIVQAKLI